MLVVEFLFVGIVKASTGIFLRVFEVFQDIHIPEYPDAAASGF